MGHLKTPCVRTVRKGERKRNKEIPTGGGGYGRIEPYCFKQGCRLNLYSKAWIQKNVNFENFVIVISQLKLPPILKILVSIPHN